MSSKLHIVAITAFIKNHSQDKFLVVKRHRDELAFPSKWAFPGGKTERGENILQTLKREVLEEVNLEITNKIKFLKDYTFIRPDDQNVVGLCFEVIATSENVKISKDFEDFKWITPQELSELDHINGMEEEVKLAFNLK